MGGIFTIANIDIQTINVGRYTLRVGDAGGGGNKRRFFFRLFLGRCRVFCNSTGALRDSDGMAVSGSSLEYRIWIASSSFTTKGSFGGR
jgi:hypothetical protein